MYQEQQRNKKAKTSAVPGPNLARFKANQQAERTLVDRLHQARRKYTKSGHSSCKYKSPFKAPSTGDSEKLADEAAIGQSSKGDNVALDCDESIKA